MEADTAVMVDLPDAEASPHGPSDAAEGPERSAAAAQAAAPDAPQPKAPDEMPPDAPELPPTPDRPAELAAAPDPAAVQPQPPEAARAPAAPSAASEETAPAGSPLPAVTAVTDAGERHPHPSARAITLWQRALMKRLDSARRQFSANAGPGGTATVAFDIGGRGELLAERIASSSGSRALDDIALQLVKRAAPFPTPPAGSRDADLSFTVPVRFR